MNATFFSIVISNESELRKKWCLQDYFDTLNFRKMYGRNQKYLLGLDKKALTEYFEKLGHKPFRATQVLQWIHSKGVSDFSLMTNLSKDLRTQLENEAEVVPPEIISEILLLMEPESG